MTGDQAEQPLYSRIYSQLREQLESGALGPKARLTPERELAARLGVSRLTVTKAVERLVREGLLERRVGSGTYVTDRAAVIQRGRRRLKRVAVLVPYGRDAFVSSLVKALSQRLDALGCSMLFLDSDGNAEREARHLEQAADAGHADGLIAFPVSMVHNEDAYRAHVASGQSVVFVDRFFPTIDAPYVVTDNIGGAHSAVARLIQEGHRVIAHLCPVERRNTAQIDRRLGYERALLAAGYEPDPALIRAVGPLTGATLRGDGQGAAQVCGPVLEEWLARPEPPTAVFCTNDYVLEAAVLAHRALRGRISADLALAGFCDRVDWLVHVRRPFLGVRQNVQRIAAVAIEKLEKSRDPSAEVSPCDTLGAYIQPELWHHSGS